MSTTIELTLITMYALTIALIAYFFFISPLLNELEK